MRFLTLTALATLAPFFLVEDQRDLRRLFAWTVAIAVRRRRPHAARPRAETGG